MTSQELLNSNELLGLLIIQCPDCEKLWLAPGVENGETYACRECGLNFVVRRPAAGQGPRPAAQTDQPEMTNP